MLGARFGKRPAVGAGAAPLFLFSREFDLSRVDADEVERAESSGLSGPRQARPGSSGTLDAASSAPSRQPPPPLSQQQEQEQEQEQQQQKQRARRSRASSDRSASSAASAVAGSASSSSSGGEYAALLRHFRNIAWMTYRSGFVPMKPPSSFMTDAGWGCMLRSAQMLLAQVLVRHLGPSEWGQRAPASHAHRNLLRWFLDAPKYFCFYSIHRMTECGRQYGKQPGEWYGPHTAALVLRDLVTSHSARKMPAGSDSGAAAAAAHPRFLEKDYYSIVSAQHGQDIAVMVTDPSATLYLDETLRLCEKRDEQAVSAAAAAAGDAAGDDPLLRPHLEPEWKSALFLIVPLRLGLHSLQDDYVAPLLAALKFPQCVGVIGGRPAHSLYFVGSQGRDLVYLDPHTVQPAASERECDDEFFPYQDVVESYHCRHPRMIPALNIDPSLAVGFYCRTGAELCDLVARLGQLSAIGTPVLAVMHTRPAYEEEEQDEQEDEPDSAERELEQDAEQDAEEEHEAACWPGAGGGGESSSDRDEQGAARSAQPGQVYPSLLVGAVSGVRPAAAAAAAASLPVSEQRRARKLRAASKGSGGGGGGASRTTTDEDGGFYDARESHAEAGQDEDGGGDFVML